MGCCHIQELNLEKLLKINLVCDHDVIYELNIEKLLFKINK